jgi:CRISPR/Cas system-associated exonuclease Cas4 (RecB family)
MNQPDPNTRLISGSEVGTWQICEMKWWFQFRLGVQPKRLSDGLFRGTLGHEMLSTFYATLKEGGSIKEASYEMNKAIAREVMKSNEMILSGFVNPIYEAERFVLIQEVATILKAYVEYYAESDYEKYDIVEVEHMHVSGNFFAMRLDLLLREVVTGDLVLMDHKFLRDFYIEKQLKMNSQLPRYMRVVIGDKEEPIKHAFINALRTRKVQDQYQFERALIPYREKVADKRASDQEKIADKIRAHYHMTQTESRRTVIRTLNDSTCKMCAFTEACLYDLEGKENAFRESIRFGFERSTYGYNK